MPRHELTTTPSALPGITIGTNYTVQNRSPNAIYIQTTDTTPTDTSGAFVMAPAPGNNSAGIVKANSGESIFVWGSRAGGAVVYDEAP